MSPTRIEPKYQPIELDLTASFSFERGLGRAKLLQLAPRLEAVRSTLLTSAGNPWQSIAQPRRLLAEYHKSRRNSLLGQILTVAKRLREVVDRALILAAPPAISTAQALFAACCHPYHNELSRGERGGRPRIYFVPAV